MLKSIDSHSERFLADVRAIDSRLARAQRQLSSGKRIHSASDAPAELPSLLATRTELAQMGQLRFNLGRIKTEVDTAEQSIRLGVDVMDRALAVGSQGATGTATAQVRQILAGEVKSLLGQLVGIAGAKVEGRHIFAGDSDQTVPYTLDLTQASPVSAYGGSASTRETAHPSGTRFLVAYTAQEVFDSSTPSANVFQSLVSLYTSLESSDIDAINASVATVRSASDHLNNKLAGYGTIQNRVAEATEFATKQELHLKVRLSGLEDADLASAATDLSEANFIRQTAFQAESRRPRQSLFDFLG